MAIVKPNLKFLITGANSYLGFPLIRALNIKYSARNVLATDIYDPLRSFGCDFSHLDVTKRELLREFTVKHKPTHIIHFGIDRSL